ncbi:uncharacterized protein BP5553_06001 [Venustampulla echinocandica]|uniref:Uncharacterized protein n=1 Tax=Venustampulla echinocandica TaxID=2656787 RepID=A0A370TM92_9HELO|nr:uncharacterized protein BP5553_06001 [Venustampulla echinocandica]RDL36649.1 hypothetical protein BP5553_06001 [Venustampulla echinocandica]
MSEIKNGHNNQHNTLPRTVVREACSWSDERPLTFYYYGDKKKALAEMAGQYFWGAGGWNDLIKKVPPGTNWLTSCRPQMIRCKNQEVLLVLGWCPVRDEVTDLDAIPSERCLTEQIINFIEEYYGKKVLFLDFFPDCRTGLDETGCTGGTSYVQENSIHCIALMVTITVALREYTVEISSVWGFGKMFQEEIDQAVFEQLPWLENLPRSYLPWHISKISDRNLEKSKVLTTTMLESLAIHLGGDVPEIYTALNTWLKKVNSDFELPDEITQSSVTAEKVVSLLQPFAPPGLMSMPEKKRKQKRTRVSEARKMQKSYPHGILPQKYWSPLQKDMDAADALLQTHGLTISAPLEKHKAANYIPGWKICLTTAEKKSIKAGLDAAANERRFARALVNLRRLKEARAKLETVGVALICDSLTQLK